MDSAVDFKALFASQSESETEKADSELNDDQVLAEAEDEEDDTEEEVEPTPGVPGSGTPHQTEHDHESSVKKDDEHHRMFRIHHVHFPLPIQILILLSMPWELFMVLVIFVNLMLVTFMAFFDYGKNPYMDGTERLGGMSFGLVNEDILFLVDCIFAFDVFLRLAVEAWRARRNILCVIFVLQYTFTTLVLDLFTMIPWDTIFVYILGKNKLSTLYYVGFIRLYYLIRYRRVYRFFETVKIDLSLEEKTMFVMRTFFDYMMWIQGFACLLYFSTDVSYLDWLMYRAEAVVDSKTTGSYLSFRRDRRSQQIVEETNSIPSAVEIWAMSMDYVVTTVTQIGFGHSSALKASEQIIMMLVMLVAVWLNSEVGSNLFGFYVERDQARFNLFHRLAAILRHYSHIPNCSGIFLKKVEEYYRYLWYYREGLDEPDLSGMPNALQEEIMLDICQEMFTKSIFSELETSFLTILARRVKIQLYNPDRIVCKEGEQSGIMYFLIQGELTIRSSSDPEHISGILRPGVVLGDTNFLVAYPNMLQVETRTVCQMLVLRRVDIIDLLEEHPYSYYQIRKRVEDIFEKMEMDYDFFGEYPIVWGVRRDDIDESEKPACTIRRSTWFNRRVTHDIIDDTSDTYIISMPCRDRTVSKDYNRVYRMSTVQHIYIYDQPWLNVYNHFVLFYLFILGIIYPYCYGFHRDDEGIEVSVTGQMCDSVFGNYIFILGFSFLYAMDVLVEIMVATPHSGMFFKFWDGLWIRTHQLDFYLDVVCAIPIFEHLWWNNIFLFPTMRVIIKAYKVQRYFLFLENIYPNRMLMIRFMKNVLKVMYATHWIACILERLDNALPYKRDHNSINPTSWLDSYFVKYNDPDKQREILGERMPYLYAVSLAASMIASNGFTEFIGQYSFETLILMILQIGSVFIILHFSADMTSALACLVRPQLVCNQKIAAVTEYLQYLRVPQYLRDRVDEHFRLQYQLTNGVELGKHRRLLHDAPKFLSLEAVYYDNELLLEGIPLFAKASDEIIEGISNLMRPFLIPPGITFMQKGEVRRQMYIIVKGRVGMIEDTDFYDELMESEDPDKMSKIRYAALLDSTAYFGMMDLLAAEPSKYDVRTLTYVHLYAIDLTQIEQIFAGDKLLKAIMDEEKNRVQAELEKQGSRTMKKRQVIDNMKTFKSWILFPRKKGDDLPHCSWKEFDEGFYGIRFAWFFWIFLMRRTIHPRGLFARSWIYISSFVSFVNLILLFIESYAGFRPMEMRIASWVLDYIYVVNMYIRLHFAYYTKDKRIFITHPVRTAIRYIWHGTFFFDLCFVTPYEFLVVVFGGTNIWGYGVGASWYTKLRWVRMFQFLKFRAIFRMLHRVFNGRIFVLTALYVVMTSSVCLMFGAVAMYVGCPWHPRDWQAGDELKLPACLKGGWAKITPTLENFPFRKRLILGLYYVSQSFFSAGFGDLVQLKESELMFMMLVACFGLLIMQYIIADVTAAQVDSDEIRASFTEKRVRLLYIFKREGLNRALIHAVSNHLKHTWTKSQGLQPKELFEDLHPALETQLYRFIVGDKLQGIPIFQNLTDTIRGALCQLLRKQYFLRGERLARAGNLENEMFIVLEGTLYICDKQLNWKCSLEHGETFGEIAVLYGIPRKYSAIAATKLEVFSLNAEEVAFLLDRYPAMKHRILDQLEDSMEDIFECKIPTQEELDFSADLSIFEYSEKREMLSKEVKTLVHDIELQTGVHGHEEEDEEVYRKTKWERFKHSLAGWGTQDTRLPFFYFATDNPKKFKFLIHPNCGFIAALNHVILLICYFSPCTEYYQYVFRSPDHYDRDSDDVVSSFVGWFAMALEVIMVLVFGISFIKPFPITADNQYCKEFRKIAIHNATILRTWLSFITVIPITYIFNNIRTALCLIKFIRLLHFYVIITHSKSDLDISIFRYRLTIAGSAFFLASHIFACLFYDIVCEVYTASNVTCESVSWVKVYEDQYIHEGDTLSQQRVFWYMRSLYFIVATITTTGYGDITPVNFKECCLVTAVILMGAFAINVIIGSISTGLTSLTQAQRNYFNNVRQMANHLCNVGLSREREEMLLAYFILLWQQCRGVRIDEALHVLPLSMRFDAAMLLFSNTIKHCKFFGTIGDLSFIRNVCVRLRHEVFLPGLNIINEDQYGDSLYIIYRGAVAAFEMNINRGLPRFLKKYTINEAFGKVPALFHQAAYNKVYRTEMRTELLILSQKDIKLLALFYPKWKSYLLERIIEKRYKKLTKDMINIFETGDILDQELLRD